MIEIRIIIEESPGDKNVVDIGVFNRGEGTTGTERKLKENIEAYVSAMAQHAIQDGGTVVERRYPK